MRTVSISSIFFLMVVCKLFAQKNQQLTIADTKKISLTESSLKQYADQIVNGREVEDRFEADSNFIRLLVKSLKTRYSFYYPFDSLKTISIIYPPDSSFRIFSWQIEKDFETHRRRAAIQMNTTDGSLKLFPLFDVANFSNRLQDSIRTINNWIGNIYYQIIRKEWGHKKYYTLIGYDENNARSTKKWIEVLYFDNQGKPLFGGPFFSFAKDSVIKPTAFRFNLEYKKDGRVRMRYDQEMDMIIYDHLISETNEPDKPYTLIPDGDYEGFKWVNGRWLQINKVFDFSLKDGEAPVPEPF